MLKNFFYSKMIGGRQYFATKRYNKNVLEFLEFLDRENPRNLELDIFTASAHATSSAVKFHKATRRSLWSILVVKNAGNLKGMFVL